MKTMNKIDIIKRFAFLSLVVILMASCENQENVFPDYKDAQGNLIKNVYFPIQYPVRTLSLNEFSRLDNSMDLNKSFSIGVGIGGYYKQDENHTVFVELAPNLADSALMNGDTVRLLPSNYYTLSATEIQIKKGDWNGTLQVNLTDDFFNDPLAIKGNYVVPLRITGTSNPEVGVLSGTVIEGLDEVTADPRDLASWVTPPKDYTLFAVKFINRFHGQYLHKGIDVTINGPGGLPIATDSYDERYLEQNLITEMRTMSLNTCEMRRVGRDNSQSMLLTLNDSNEITITSAEGSSLNISGTGKMIQPGEDGAETWGGQEYITLELAYTYDDGVEYHRVQDVLVYRNDGLIFEEFAIELY